MRTYILSLLVLAFLLVFHTLGISQGYYLIFWPYDIFAHIFGGLGIGLFLIAAARTFWPVILNGNRTAKIVFLVFVVGLIWEIFEVIYNIAGYSFGTKAYFIDTIKDLIDDVIGGFLAVYLDRFLNK